MIVLEVFKSDFDLRDDFKKSKKLFVDTEEDRFSWLKRIVHSDDIKEVRFFIAKAA